MMNTNLAYNTYTQNNIGVESPQKLVQMMYEGVLRFNMQAKRSMKEDDIEKKVYWVNRSSAIIAHLISVIDYSGGDVAHYLSGLYTHQLQLLAEANLHNDAERLDEVSKVFKGLLEGWKEITDVAIED